jgi:hypothetical protein
MKKSYTLVLLLLSFSIGGILAQVPRTMLVEHFTQASCGPCASLNPALHTLLENNPSVAYIKYQVSWPGTDPMNAHNPSHVNVRVNFYDVTGVPSTIFDGNVYKGSPSGFTQAMINNRASVSSPFSLTVSSRLNPSQDSIFVTAIVRKEADTSNTGVYTRIAVLEKHIQFTTPPGSNGERDFYHVMKRMLPHAVGTALPAAMAVGESDTIEVAWKLANVYDIEQLMVTAFIQNNNNNNVYQAAFTEAGMTSADKSLDIPAIHLYPNPATSQCTLSFPFTEKSTISLLNMMGQNLLTEMPGTACSEYTLNVQNLQPGLYLCKVSEGSQEFITRLLIQAQGL